MCSLGGGWPGEFSTLPRGSKPGPSRPLRRSNPGAGCHRQLPLRSRCGPVAFGSLPCPAHLLRQTNLSAARRRSPPRTGIRTSTVQLPQDRKSRVHVPELVYQIRSLRPQLRYYGHQSLELCHESSWGEIVLHAVRRKSWFRFLFGTTARAQRSRKRFCRMTEAQNTANHGRQRAAGYPSTRGFC
jgi:hypothetical protein